MSWTSLDDTLHSHPKVIEAGVEAMGLWCLALSYCGAYLTEGWIKRGPALRIAGNAEALAARLVAARLWDVHPSGDGWQFHDYLQHNLSRDQVLARRQAKQRAGQAGAEKRWGGGATVNDTGDSRSMTPAMPLPSPLSCSPPVLSSPSPLPSTPKERSPGQTEIASDGAFSLTAENPLAESRVGKTREAPREKAKKTKKAKKAKHTPDEIAAKDALVALFIATVKARKGASPKVEHAADHAAAYALMKTYGAEATAIVTRALDDGFVLRSNCTLRYIASKPDTWRGKAPRTSGRRAEQLPADPGEECWEMPTEAAA